MVIVPNYIEYFGFKISPFENVPDPKFFFNEGDHARIHNNIKTFLKIGRGLTVVTGPVGSGKTTLSQMIMSELTNNVRLIWMAEPPRSSVELLLFIANALGLQPLTTKKTFLLRDIRNALININAKGGKCLVIIDESHLMLDDVFNGIRLLNNLEDSASKLIQILLLGQEELIEIINKPEMEAFRQRISSLEIIGNMSTDRIPKYISHRIQVAGGKYSIFTDTGWAALFFAFGSGSIPRIINSLCDRSLGVAYERKKVNVDAYDVYEASREMGLSKEVFHYIVKLRANEQNNQVLSSRNNTHTKEPKPIFKGIDKQSDKVNMYHDIMQSELSYLSHRDYEMVKNINQKGLKKPLLFLALSTAALIFSIYFYCQSSNFWGMLLLRNGKCFYNVALSHLTTSSTYQSLSLNDLPKLVGYI